MITKYKEIVYDFFDMHKCCFVINAYLTDNNDEDGYGRAIFIVANVNPFTKKVEYFDNDAKTDEFVKIAINKVLNFKIHEFNYMEYKIKMIVTDKNDYIYVVYNDNGKFIKVLCDLCEVFDYIKEKKFESLKKLNNDCKDFLNKVKEYNDLIDDKTASEITVLLIDTLNEFCKYLEGKETCL